MSRLIFIIAVVAIVYLLLKSYRKRVIGQGPDSGTQQAGRAEDMVRCIYCGVHLPKSEAILADGRHYCCEAHRSAHQAPTNRDAG